MKRSIALCVYASLLLSACSLVEVSEEAPVEQPPVEDTTPVPETTNVTYTGTVQPAGISIYQQGSHRLVLDEGKFILLESDLLDLNGYVEEHVQVFGALRPTVEAGGMIMRVERITLLDEEEGGEDEVVETEAEENTEESEQETEVIEEQPEASDEIEEETEEVEVDAEELPVNEGEEPELEEAVDEPVEEVVTEEVERSYSPEYLENEEIMLKQDYTTANWTQSYCSSHVGFCTPVHRNFWFKSFGATETSLWHVEFSVSPVESMGQGPIVLTLKGGSKADADGSVDIVSGKAIGYREWTFGRHFVIEAHEELEGAVTYMVQNISEFTQ